MDFFFYLRHSEHNFIMEPKISVSLTKIKHDEHLLNLLSMAFKDHFDSLLKVNHEFHY